MTVIGYGSDPDGRKYWIAKNSYGPEWGERGYIRIERDIADSEGRCGIAMSPWYPSSSLSIKFYTHMLFKIISITKMDC